MLGHFRSFKVVLTYQVLDNVPGTWYSTNSTALVFARSVRIFASTQCTVKKREIPTFFRFECALRAHGRKKSAKKLHF